MIPPLFNARNLALSVAVRPAPTADSTLRGWLMNLGLTRIVKKNVAGGVRTEEVEVPFPGRGNWQPLGGKQLEIKPEGERSWDWVVVHIDAQHPLDTDDVVVRRGVRWRVMAIKGWDDNGLRVYELVNDYQRGARA